MPAPGNAVEMKLRDTLYRYAVLQNWPFPSQCHCLNLFWNKFVNKSSYFPKSLIGFMTIGAVYHTADAVGMQAFVYNLEDTMCPGSVL